MPGMFSINAGIAQASGIQKKPFNMAFFHASGLDRMFKPVSLNEIGKSSLVTKVSIAT